MKRIALVFFLLLPAVQGFSQSLISVFGGAGVTTAYSGGTTPLFGATYLVSPLRHTYFGGSIFNEGYAVKRTDEEFSRFGGYEYSITQNSSFLFIAPTIDVGVGHKEHIHGYVSGGLGFRLSGEQTLQQTTPGTLPPGIYSGHNYGPSKNTTANLNNTIFRLGLGACGHIGILDKLDLVIGPELGLIPSWLSTNSYGYEGDASMNIKASYVCVHLGLTYKSGWQPFSARRTWGGY
jgi:hypothetical protein